MIQLFITMGVLVIVWSTITGLAIGIIAILTPKNDRAIACKGALALALMLLMMLLAAGAVFGKSIHFSEITVATSHISAPVQTSSPTHFEEVVEEAVPFVERSVEEDIETSETEIEQGTEISEESIEEVPVESEEETAGDEIEESETESSEDDDEEEVDERDRIRGRGAYRFD
ncbi:MAG: hypothetical protein ABH837_00800 [bacterium]